MGEQSLFVDSLIGLSHLVGRETKDVISLSALVNVRLLPPKCSVLSLPPHDVCICILCAGAYGPVQSATLIGSKTNPARRERRKKKLTGLTGPVECAAA